jgi:hypothetical protein
MRNLCSRDEVGVQMKYSLDPGRPNPLIYVLLKLTLKHMTDPGKRQFISVIELCSVVRWYWWLLLLCRRGVRQGKNLGTGRQLLKAVLS